MPLDNYFTKPDYSRQLKQYSGTSAVFSGQTNILEKFSVKSIEIDTAGAVLGDALLFDSIKFRPGQPGGFSGSVISNGFNLSYVSGLTYYVSPGSYRFNNTIYAYTGEFFDILPGQTGGSRFDLVFISAGTVNISVRTGTTTTNPTVPNLQIGELEVGIISVPAGFTGGTGSTVIQTSGESVFVYFNNGAGTGIQRAAVGANTQAPGSFSFAVGRDSDAYAPDSVTLGVDTKASGNSQTVVGTFNIPTTTDYFIVGYGTDDSNRANAFNITNAGDTYANRKLFVTNVEIETTGASIGQVLKFDGTKFKPQLETITGATSFSGGIPIFSSITNNTLLFKSISAGTNVTLTESSGTIFINVEFSGASISGLTEILSLTGGTSIISGKTGSTYFLYPIQGSGGTQVVLSNNRILIYSDTSASTTGANVGPVAAAGVYKEKVLNELRFRRLTSITSNYLTIQESTGLNELILFSSNPPITGSTNATGSSVGVLASVSNRNVVGRTLTGTNRASVTQAADLITINSPIEVDTGADGHLAVYKSTNPIVYSAYSGNIPFIGPVSNLVVKLKTHTTIITSRTYNIVDVKKDADFVMTEGNQNVNGIKNFITGFTIGNTPNTSVNYPINRNLSLETIDGVYNTYTLFSDPESRFVAGFNSSAAGNIKIYGGQEVYFLPYVTELIDKPINPLTTTIFSANTNAGLGSDNNVPITTVTHTVGKYSYIKLDVGQIASFSSQTIVGNINRIDLIANTGANWDTRDKQLGHFFQTNFTNQRARFYRDEPIINAYFETSPIALTFDAGPWNKTRTLQLGHINKTWAYGQQVVEGIDLYLARPKSFASGYNGYSNPFNGLGGLGYPQMTYTTHAAIFIENRRRTIEGIGDDVINRYLSINPIIYTNAPWSIFAESDRAYIGNTLALYSGLSLTSTTRGAWLDIGTGTTTRPQINFAPGSVAPSTLRTGDMWFDGTVLKFRLSSSTVNLTSGTSITGGSIGSSNGGGIDIYKTTVGDTLQFRSLSSSTDSSFLSVVQNGDLILISAGTALKGLSALTGSSLENLVFSNLTSLGTSLFDIPAPYKIYYKNLSAGTGINITDNGSLITITSTVTGGTSSGGSISGAYVSGLTPVGTGSYEILSSVTNNNLVHRTISAGTNTSISYAPDGTLVITNTGISGNTSYTGFTDIVSAGTGNYSVISSVTNNKLVYRTLSAGTGMQITESNGTLIFVSTATGSTSGGSISGVYVSGLTNLNGGINVLSSITNNSLVNKPLTGGPNTTVYENSGVIFISSQTPQSITTYVSGLTSAGTGNYSIISSITDNNLVYRTISAGTNIGITESNGTIIISGSGGISGDYLPISGGTVTGLTNFISGLSVNTISATTYYNLPTYDNEIHVSGVDGSDTTGNGELLNPVATITKALTLTTGSRKTIIVHPGGYNENITVTSGNTTIATSELTGANTVLYGTLTIGTLGSGSRISGLKMNNLVISGTAQAYISNCTVDTQVTKSSSGYVEIINSELQCTSGITIAGSGITIINGNKNVGVSVSNASAQVIIKGCNSVVTPSASAGNLAIVDSIVTALSGNAITITGALTNLTLANSQVLVQAGNNVAPISVAGIYSIINTIYDKPNSTFAGGTSTNSIDYFQYINADGLYATSIFATTISGLTFLGDASNLTGVLSKTLLTANIPVTSQVAQVNTFYLYDKLTITSATSSATVTAITSDVSISSYTPSIKFFAQTGVTVTFKNSATLKTEGGLDAVIVGSNYDSITFTYNNNIQKYFQTNINNYI